MNKTILAGRLTGDPEVRYSNNNGEQLCIAAYTLAVPRKKKDETDFIRCKCFGKTGEFAEKYLKKGMKMIVTGRIQTGSYEDKDGKKVYTTDVIVEEHEFCEPKKEETAENTEEEFIQAPEDVKDGLPWKKRG